MTIFYLNNICDLICIEIFFKTLSFKSPHCSISFPSLWSQSAQSVRKGRTWVECSPNPPSSPDGRCYFSTKYRNQFNLFYNSTPFCAYTVISLVNIISILLKSFYHRYFVIRFSAINLVAIFSRQKMAYEDEKTVSFYYNERLCMFLVKLPVSSQIFPRTTWNIFGDSQRAALLRSESERPVEKTSQHTSTRRKKTRFPLGLCAPPLFPKPRPCPSVLRTPGPEPAGSCLGHLLSSLCLSSAAQVIHHCTWTWGMSSQKSPRKGLVEMSQETQESRFDVFPWHLLWLCPPSRLVHHDLPLASSRPPPGQKQSC